MCIIAVVVFCPCGSTILAIFPFLIFSRMAQLDDDDDYVRDKVREAGTLVGVSKDLLATSFLKKKNVENSSFNVAYVNGMYFLLTYICICSIHMYTIYKQSPEFIRDGSTEDEKSRVLIFIIYNNRKECSAALFSNNNNSNTKPETSDLIKSFLTSPDSKIIEIYLATRHRQILL